MLTATWESLLIILCFCEYSIQARLILILYNGKMLYGPLVNFLVGDRMEGGSFFVL